MLSRLAMARPVAINNPLAQTAIHGSRQFHSSWFKGLFGGKKDTAIADASQPKKKVPIKLRKDPEVQATATNAKPLGKFSSRKIKLELESSKAANTTPKSIESKN